MLVRFAPHFPSTTLFNDLFREFGNTEERTQTFAPPADIRDTEKTLEIQLDLPGVKPDAIDVKVDRNRLTITAQRAAPPKEAEGTWVRTERSWGQFTRTFTLPPSVDGSQPEATYKHGVLTLTLPKKAEAQPKSVAVKVEA